MKHPYLANGTLKISVLPTFKQTDSNTVPPARFNRKMFVSSRNKIIYGVDAGQWTRLVIDPLRRCIGQATKMLPYSERPSTSEHTKGKNLEADANWVPQFTGQQMPRHKRRTITQVHEPRKQAEMHIGKRGGGKDRPATDRTAASN